MNQQKPTRSVKFDMVVILVFLTYMVGIMGCFAVIYPYGMVAPRSPIFRQFIDWIVAYVSIASGITTLTGIQCFFLEWLGIPISFYKWFVVTVGGFFLSFLILYGFSPLLSHQPPTFFLIGILCGFALGSIQSLYLIKEWRVKWVIATILSVTPLTVFAAFGFMMGA